MISIYAMDNVRTFDKTAKRVDKDSHIKMVLLGTVCLYIFYKE